MIVKENTGTTTTTTADNKLLKKAQQFTNKIKLQITCTTKQTTKTRVCD